MSWLICQDCHRQFKSYQCFKQHKKSREQVGILSEHAQNNLRGSTWVTHEKSYTDFIWVTQENLNALKI